MLWSTLFGRFSLISFSPFPKLASWTGPRDREIKQMIVHASVWCMGFGGIVLL